MDRKETLQQAIDRAARLYYYTGKPAFTDDQYDAMIAELKDIDPTDIRVTQVGAPPPDNMFKKVQNRASTNSLAKVDTEEDLRKWYRDNGENGEIMVELKADGSSVLLYVVDGVLDQVVTRGGDDGIGQDITRNGMKFKGVPSVIQGTNGPVLFTGVVRGEALLLTEDYKKIDPLMSGQVRNIGNGIINRGDGTDSELITLLAFNYEVLEGGGFDVVSEEGKLATLEMFGFTTMIHHLSPTIDDAINYWKEVDVKRKNNELTHQIDGIVFKLNDVKVAKALGMSSGRPNSERVLKFEAPGAPTRIIGLTKTVGKTGAQIPTAILEPVIIDKTIVKSGQLNNWEIITALDIAIGDLVYVRKAKDIIPEIVEVLERPATRQPIPEPTACYVCGGEAGRVELVGGGISARTFCKNPDCSAKSIRKIASWIDKNRILGVGDTILEALVEKFDMNSPADLYRRTAEETAGLEIGNGVLGIKNATKIYDNIQATRKMSLNNFMGSLSIRHLGRRMTQITRDKVPGQLDMIGDWISGKFMHLDCGMPNKGGEIWEDIQTLRPVIDDLLQYVEIAGDTDAPSPEGGILAGKTFCLTGTMTRKRPDIHSDIIRAGGIVLDDAKKGLDYLVIADPNSSSSKAVKARKNGTKLISEQQLNELLSEREGISVSD